MPNLPGRVSIPMSEYVRDQLRELAAQYQADEQLLAAPTYDDVIRRLLRARADLAELLLRQAQKEGTSD